MSTVLCVCSVFILITITLFVDCFQLGHLYNDNSEISLQVFSQKVAGVMFSSLLQQLL